jgi:hypothetical protein
MRVVNHANLKPEGIARIESALLGQENLNDVIKWALSHPQVIFNTSVVSQVIVQDEFTYDVIVPYRDGLVIVYGNT